MSLVSVESLRSLENEVRHALASGDESKLTILGYGEVTTVLLLETHEGRFACKRLPVFKTRAIAEHCVSTIGRYVTALKQTGIEPVENEAMLLEWDDGGFVVYSVQPALPVESIGPNYFRSISSEAAVEEFKRVIDLVAGAVSPRLAPDGQLSNWAFIDRKIFYLDVSSPFMRDESGKNLLEWKYYLKSMPAPARPIILRWVLPGILNNYHSLRGQIVDFLGNLQKERLEHLISDLIPVANERLGLDPPIEEKEIEAYYKSDASTYAVIYKVRKFDRWFQRTILCRTYPFLLSPPVDRNL